MNVSAKRSTHLLIKLKSLNLSNLSKCTVGDFERLTRNYSDVPALQTTISESCIVNPCNPEPKVLIVGAGLAGLSAAARLAQCGITNFIVLEATERPGGRVHSCWLGDVVAELGAQWIDGACLTNSVYNLACQENLFKTAVDRVDPSKSLFCTSDGRAVNFPVSVTAYHTFQFIKQQAANLFKHSSNSSGTLLNFLAIRIQQELYNFPEDQRCDAARVMFGLGNALKSRLGEDLSLISADNFGSQIFIPGGKISIPLGFVGVLAPILKSIPPNKIHYSKPVNIIKYGFTRKDQPRASVVCCDGDTFSADYVIVTVSLGCLKCQMDRLFCPPLPANKRNAIENLGYGLSDKIFLEYCAPFWLPNEMNLRLAWSADELRVRGDWTTGVCCFDELPGSSHVLCASIAGEEAGMMEQMSERDVVEGLTQLLRKFTGNPCLPYPKAVLRSSWGSDPHFCGSYSYMSLDSTVPMQCDLADPIPSMCEPGPPILLFAGEATAPGHFASVHGARVSGIREAERIVQLTKKYSGPPR